MRERSADRRRNSGEFRVRPPKSAANLLILTVAGVLLATAAATVFLDGGMEDDTPHGMLLGALRQVAERQEAFHHQNGRFAGWLRTLEMEPPDGSELMLLEGGTETWKAIARHPVGLSCVQGGHMDGGRPVRDEPACFTSPDD